MKKLRLIHAAYTFIRYNLPLKESVQVNNNDKDGLMDNTFPVKKICFLTHIY
jgi:hypothetical protein